MNVGEKREFAVSAAELANVLGQHIADREHGRGLPAEGGFKPWVEVVMVGGNILVVNVTLERTR